MHSLKVSPPGKSVITWPTKQFDGREHVNFELALSDCKPQRFSFNFHQLIIMQVCRLFHSYVARTVLCSLALKPGARENSERACDGFLLSCPVSTLLLAIPPGYYNQPRVL